MNLRSGAVKFNKGTNIGFRISNAPVSAYIGSVQSHPCVTNSIGTHIRHHIDCTRLMVNEYGITCPYQKRPRGWVHQNIDLLQGNIRLEKSSLPCGSGSPTLSSSSALLCILISRTSPNGRKGNAHRLNLAR